MPSEAATALNVAAVVYEAGDRIQEFFAHLAGRLAGEGIIVAGLLQHSLRANEDDRCIVRSYGDVSLLPSPIFFFGPAIGEEFSIDIEGFIRRSRLEFE